MALFGSSNSYLGLDIGTSSLKVIELVDRKRRVEVSTYAQANLPNLLLENSEGNDDYVRRTAHVINQMLDQAAISADSVVVSLPSSIVFSTTLTLPLIPSKDMDEAVRFAARDIVPADLDEMVLGWSKVGQAPHMNKTADKKVETTKVVPEPSTQNSKAADINKKSVPIYLTAAPKNIIDRYEQVVKLIDLDLIALEVETFPLMRSLLPSVTDSAMIIDLGDQITTFHLIDKGTPQLSHSIDFGGGKITTDISTHLSISLHEAEQQKIATGIISQESTPVATHIQEGVDKMIQQAQQLQKIHDNKSLHDISKTVLIGGGANMKGIQQYWMEKVGHPVKIGNPWKGLSYPKSIEDKVLTLGPTFAVAVGLAQRGMIQ